MIFEAKIATRRRNRIRVAKRALVSGVGFDLFGFLQETDKIEKVGADGFEIIREMVLVLLQKIHENIEQASLKCLWRSKQEQPF